MLVAFVAGTYAASMEAKSDAEVAESLMVVLRQCFGAGIPAPTQVRVREGVGWGRVPVGCLPSTCRARVAPCIQNQLIPTPDARRLQSIVTRWGKDPFSLGSYSYTKKLATGNYNHYASTHKKCAARGGRPGF